jgi:predicted O-methyltransferase YrrM
MKRTCLFFITLAAVALVLPGATVQAGERAQSVSDLDAKVRSFLESRRGTWRDMNVPESDGRILYETVVKHGYKRALEIGTSTGHSGI